MHMRCECSKLSLFEQSQIGQQSVVFVTSHEFE
jgi:hypothetical protein